jgi:predicted RNA binding protein YcfA (HicA-like mRNA interferase family)
LLQRIKSNPGGTRFSDLQRLLGQFGFVWERIEGSHHLYRRADGRMCNVQQSSDAMAKKYQVELVLKAIDAAG